MRNLGAVFLLSEAGEGEEGAGSLEPVDETSAAMQAEENDILSLLVRAMSSLSEEQYSVLRMHYFEHRSMTEIAADRKVHKATISRLHHKALLALREAMGVEEDPG